MSIETDDYKQHPFMSKPHRTIIVLTIPATLSMIAEPITGAVDTAFVARLGAVPLAALGIGAAGLSSIFWVFNFLSISAQTEVAQAIGRKNHRRAVDIASLALILGVLVGIVMILLGIPLAPAISRLLGANDAVLDNAVLYFRVRLFAAPAVLITLVGFGVLRGLQDMRTPLVIAVLVNVLNIVLDYPLIFGYGAVPALGVGGSALASVIAQYVGASLVLWQVVQRLGLRWYLRFDEIRALMQVGSDLFLRTSLLMIFILLTTRMANQISPEAGAAHQALRTIWMVLGLMMDGFAVTAQSLVGYFIGAKQVAIARRAATYNLAWGLLLGCGTLLVMLLSENLLIALLVPDESVSVFGRAWLIAALSQPLAALAFVTDGIHWGTGDYTFLRNAMLTATGISALLLFLVDPTAGGAFTLLWGVTLVWVLLRTVLGVGRIYLNTAGNPLRVANA